jgi:hypothetical protein
VTADGQSTTNVTAQLTDSEGNAVGQNGISVSFDIRSNASEAGASLNQTSATTDSSGQASVALTAENASYDIDVRAIASGQQDIVTVSSVEPAAADFQLELADGPTTITQNESYSATLSVTNEGDGAGTQDIEYDLEDSTGISQIDASEEVSLDAGNSTEITFEVPASATNNLETGNYTHVFASDDDELTVDAEVVEEGADETALARFDAGDDGTIDRDEAVSAIVAYNTDGTVGGEPVTRDQAVNVIIAYNTRASV